MLSSRILSLNVALAACCPPTLLSRLGQGQELGQKVGTADLWCGECRPIEVGGKGTKCQHCTPLSQTEVLADDNMASKIFVSAAFTEGAGERHKVFMMARCNKRLGEITRNMRDELRLCICQEVPRLFSSGEHRTVTEIVAREIMILNPDADRDSICRFDANGLLRDWNMSYCSITELPESFRDLLCTGDLNLNENKLRCLPPNFEQIRVGGSLRLSGNQLQSLPRSFATLSVGGNLNLSGNKLRRLPPNFEQIRVGGSLRLSGNPELTGIPTEFPNVKGTVYRP